MLHHSDSNHTILYHDGSEAILALVLGISNCYFHRGPFYLNVNHSTKSGRRKKSITYALDLKELVHILSHPSEHASSNVGRVSAPHLVAAG